MTHNPSINIPTRDGKPSYETAKAGISTEVEIPFEPGTQEFDEAVKKQDALTRFLYLQRLSWELGFVQDVRNLGITQAMIKEWKSLGVEVENG
jgi:hypothetical protein